MKMDNLQASQVFLHLVLLIFDVFVEPLLTIILNKP